MMASRWPPRTPVAAAGLLWAGSRLLLLCPTYKQTWTLPGGCVEEGESPLVGCLREVREETGLIRAAGVLRCVDYRRPGAGEGGLRFVFDLGELADAEEQLLQLPPEEIAASRFVMPDETLRLLDAAQARRVSAVLSSGAGVLYLEDGVVPDRT